MAHEAISVFDMFKVGIGPSSSHTLGPWRAAQRFLVSLQTTQDLFNLIQLRVLLYGSLAKTGIGHGTDIAVQLGLSGDDPVSFDVNNIQAKVHDILAMKKLIVNGRHEIDFDPREDIEFFITESLPYHPNALTFLASFRDHTQISETYYSVGGGFVEKEGERGNEASNVILPFPVNTAAELLHWCMKTGLAISEVVLENETAWRSENQTRADVLKIWKVMYECIYRGCHTNGQLPGGLHVKRRAAALSTKLTAGTSYQDYESWIRVIRNGGYHFKYILDWVSCFALAVNEENTAFGRVVTAPTNGAAGVIPAAILRVNNILIHKGFQERLKKYFSG